MLWHVIAGEIQSPSDLAAVLADGFLQCHDGGEPFIIWTTIGDQADTPKRTRLNLAEARMHGGINCLYTNEM